MVDDNGRLARFGAFELDVHAAELRKSGRLVALTGQPMRVLIALVRCAGEIVTRDALQRGIWGDDTHVDFDAGLSTCINQIRTALGDRAASPRFLETLPRRGYRFIAPVDWAAGAYDAPAPLAARGFAAMVNSRTGTRARIGVVLVVLLMTVPPMWSARHRQSAARPVPIAVMPVDVDASESQLTPLSLSLTHALIGTLATEAGGHVRVASEMLSRELAEKPLGSMRESGIEYSLLVTLRSVGGPVLVHVKLVDANGWVRWASDRTMALEELEHAQVRLAGEFSKQVVQAILSAQRS